MGRKHAQAVGLTQGQTTSWWLRVTAEGCSWGSWARLVLKRRGERVWMCQGRLQRWLLVVLYQQLLHADGCRGWLSLGESCRLGWVTWDDRTFEVVPVLGCSVGMASTSWTSAAIPLGVNTASGELSLPYISSSMLAVSGMMSDSKESSCPSSRRSEVPHVKPGMEVTCSDGSSVRERVSCTYESY